jgi:hypothetical protein
MATLIGSMLATSAVSASVVRPLGHADHIAAASDGPLSLVPPKPLTEAKRGYQIMIPVSVSDPEGDNSVITVTTVKGTSEFARNISHEERDKICGNSAPTAQPANGFTCNFAVGTRTFKVPVKLLSNVECGKQVPVLDWTGQHHSDKEGSTYYEIEADAIVGEAVVTVGCPPASTITSNGVRTAGCPTPSTITGKGVRTAGCPCPGRTATRGVRTAGCTCPGQTSGRAVRTAGCTCPGQTSGRAARTAGCTCPGQTSSRAARITNCTYLKPRGGVQTGGGGMALRDLPLKQRAAMEHYLLTGAKAGQAQHRS